LNIKKREGYFEKFNILKVSQVVMKALEETDEVLQNKWGKANEIAKKVEQRAITFDGELHVELIQDWIEDELMASDLKKTAKAFIKYRQKRTEIRNAGGKWMTYKEPFGKRSIEMVMNHLTNGFKGFQVATQK